jgi:chromosomal replication initiation ATPase DnaA
MKNLQIQFKKVYAPIDQKSILLNKLQKIYYVEFNLDMYMLKSRKKEIIALKQSFAYYLREFGFNLVEISEIIGVSQHGTVINALRNYNNYRNVKDELIMDISNRVERYFIKNC